MKSILTTVLLFASTAASAVTADKACWDGTFGYNYARIVTTNRGIEVSILGNSLELPSLYSYFNQPHSFVNFSKGGPSLHILLPNNAKAEGDSIVASAVMSGGVNAEGEFQPITYPILWLGQWTRDLGEDIRILTDIGLINVKLTVSDSEVELKFVQAYSPGSPHPVETISVGCRGNRAPAHVSFPERLTSYLDAK